MTSRHNPYADAWQIFRASTRNHALTVLHDDGLYRHLRMARADRVTGIWSWSVVTWPGYMTVVGDVGEGFTFCREADMLAWASPSQHGSYYGDGSPNINPDYWAEKLTGACRDSAQVWSWDAFMRHVRYILTEDETPTIDDLMADAEALDRDDPAAAIAWATEHVHQDAWEWDCRDYTPGYLRACYAIATTVRAYAEWNTGK